jgi:hypothetical protein
MKWWWWCVVARVTLSATTAQQQHNKRKFQLRKYNNNNKNRANQATKSAVEFLDASANIENCLLCSKLKNDYFSS